MDRHFIITGPIVTEWTLDEINRQAVVFHESVETPTGRFFYYYRKVVAF